MKRQIVFFILISLLSTHAYAFRDSLGMKQINKKWFVIYKVDKGIGLYTIGKKYGVSMQDIINHNPEASKGLKPDQILMIPYSGKVTTSVTEKTTTSSSSTIRSPKYFIIDSPITLYRIGLKFKVSVAQLKAWNHLESDQISIGQKLIVGYDGTGEVVKESGVNTNKTITSNNINKNTAIPKGAKTESREVQETVLASAVDDEQSGDRNLALHKTASPGTIIQVTNPMNGATVYVKVVGTLNSDLQDKNLVMKISRSTADKLGIKDDYFRLNTHYSTEVIKK